MMMGNQGSPNPSFFFYGAVTAFVAMACVAPLAAPSLRRLPRLFVCNSVCALRARDKAIILTVRVARSAHRAAAARAPASPAPASPAPFLLASMSCVVSQRCLLREAGESEANVLLRRDSVCQFGEVMCGGQGPHASRVSTPNVDPVSDPLDRANKSYNYILL